MLKTIKWVHYSVSEFEPFTLESKIQTDAEKTVDRAFIAEDQSESECSEFCLSLIKLVWLYSKVIKNKMGGTICISRQNEQVGRAILWLPWFYVNKFLDAVNTAERKLGRPPTPCEIFI